MKKTILILLAVVLPLTLISCLEFEIDSSKDSPLAYNDTTEPDSGGKSNVMLNSGTIDDYLIIIKSMQLSTNYKDEPSVIITYDFTNNSDEAKSFVFAVSSTVFQDGIECESTISSFKDKSFNSDNQMKDIKPGATLEVQKIYKLNNETSDIEVEVSEWISFSKNPATVVRTFSLSEAN